MPKQERYAIKQRMDSAINQIRRGQAILGDMKELYSKDYPQISLCHENTGVLVEVVCDIITGVKESI